MLFFVVVAVHSLMGKIDIFGSSIICQGSKGVQLFHMMYAYTLMLSFNKYFFLFS
jgi:hypothetical protein